MKVWKILSPSSPSSLDQYQARNGAQNAEDTSGSEDTYPHQDTIPSPENGQNRAQNGDSEGSEGSESIFRNLSGAGDIYRIGRSDRHGCNHCRQTGDIHYMRTHECSGNGKAKSRARTKWTW